MAATKRELEIEAARLRHKLDQMVKVLRAERESNTAMRNNPSDLHGAPIAIVRRYWQERIDKIDAVLAGWP